MPILDVSAFPRTPHEAALRPPRARRGSLTGPSPLAVVLVCPLCGTTVAEGDEAPAPGRCPGCGARYAGDAETPPGAAAALLAALELDGVDPDGLARALFALPPADPRGRRAGITSDRRDTF
jgi:hypothetical protein